MIAIGTAGWAIPKQNASEAPGEGSHLERYSRVLPCAEINSTFYRPPRASTWQRWAASVPETFRFAVKAPKAITHEAGLACAPVALRDFLQQASALEGKLGPILFQLPPKLVFDRDVARPFLETLRMVHAGPVAFEPRHASWFLAEPDALLREFEVARVAADPARVPEAARPGGWPGLRYYRLHGSPRTYYSEYTGGWLETLTVEIASQAEGDTWCIFDNTASGAAFGNALELQRLTAKL